MDNVTIPPEVVEAAGEAFLERDRVPSCSFDDCIRAAIAAGLAAWPMAEMPHVENAPAFTILPLPTENPDGE